VVVAAQSFRSVFGLKGSGLAVQVIATVLAASALWPLHDRVQRQVDRLFYGDRGAPYDALARLGRRIEEAADPESALSSVVKTIADSLRLPYAALELRLGDGWSPAAAYGEAPAQVVAFGLTFQRETVGRLLVGTRSRGQQLGPDDERLLADLARQAGPAAHAVALRRALGRVPGGPGHYAGRGAAAAAPRPARRARPHAGRPHPGPGHRPGPVGEPARTAGTAGQAQSGDAAGGGRRPPYRLRSPANPPSNEFGLVGSLREEVGRLQYEAPLAHRQPGLFR